MAILPTKHNPSNISSTEPAPTPAPTAPTPETKTETKTEAKTEAKGLDMSVITSGAVMLAPELAEETAPVRARSDKQRAMDEQVKKLHEQWVKSGKATTWAKMVESKAVATFFLDPETAPEFHRLLSRAVSFHGLRTRMGTSFKATEKMVKRYGLPENYIGREVISFAVMDKRPRAANTEGKSGSQVIAEKSK